MDTSTSSFGDFSFSVWSAIAIVVSVIVAYFALMLTSRANTMPYLAEGFGAPVVGAGSPTCLYESSEAAAIVGLFQGKVGSVEEGNPDLDELKVLLGKLCCLKRDLISVAGLVNATLYQPFMTAHDVEPIAEITGRCFAKTIPPRDLEISFDKWKTRGRLLIRRLCGASDNEQSKAKADSLFDALLVDVYDVASQKCLKGDPTIEGTPSPRDAVAFSPPQIKDLSEYKGYY